MVRITAEDLDDCMFADADGSVFAPAINPYVLTPDSNPTSATQP